MRPLVGAADSRPAAPNSVNRSRDYSAAPVQIDRPTGAISRDLPNAFRGGACLGRWFSYRALVSANELRPSPACRIYGVISSRWR